MAQDDLKPVEPDQPIFAETMNALIERANAMALGHGLPGIWDGSKFLGEPPTNAGGGSLVKRFRLVTLGNEFANYSTCQADPDGTPDGVNVNIAKPVAFRGYTTPPLYGTLAGSNNGTNISIWAVEPTGGTGVLAADSSAVTWLDISTVFPFVSSASGNFYKVLGINASGRPIWDWVRAHA